jgi:hypothetical protein
MIPWWIVTALGGDDDEAGERLAHAPLAALLDAQLLQWSLISGVMREAGAPRWWKVDALPPYSPASVFDLAQHLSNFIYNPLERRGGEDAPRVGGQTEARQLVVAVVGDVREPATRAQLHCLGRMIRLRARAKFGDDRALRLVALIHLPHGASRRADAPEVAKFLTELHTMMRTRRDAEQRITGETPFDAVVFFQDSNATASNQRGYASLTERQVTELATQIVFHLTTAESQDFDLAAPDAPHYYSVGAGALYYDWHGHKHALAGEAGRALVGRFKSATDPPFVDAAEVESAVRTVREFLAPRALFKGFVLGARRPSFAFEARVWEMARDHRNRPVSPVRALLSTALLHVYFRRHLHHLPLRISEYGRLFLSRRVRDFRDYLVARRRALWEGDEALPAGLRDRIEESATATLSTKGGRGCSLAQVERVIDSVAEACRAERLEAVVSELDDFASLEVFAVPEELRPFYEQAEPLTPAEEERLFGRIADVVRGHPVPGALLLRALLIGFMLATLGTRLLDFASPRFVNLEWLLHVPTLSWWLIFALPPAAAFVRYRVRTLTALRDHTRAYVAAILRRAQSEARGLIREEMRELSAQAQARCEELRANVAALHESLDYPESARHDYESTTFHRSILESLGIPGRDNPVPVLTARPEYQINYGGRELSFAECDEDCRHGLLRKMLEEEADGGARLGDLLAACVTAGTDAGRVARAGEAARRFSVSIYRDAERQWLDSWLAQEDPRRRAETLDRLRRLAAPPVSFHAGVANVPQVRTEWAYNDATRLRNLFGGEPPGGIKRFGEGGVLSVAVFQPFAELDHLSTLRALRDDARARDAERHALDPARLFTLATTRLEGAPEGSLLSALDGTTFQMRAEIVESAREVRRELTLGAEEPPTPRL